MVAESAGRAQVIRFAIAFEQTYIHRLYEALEAVEPREMQAPEGEA